MKGEGHDAANPTTRVSTNCPPATELLISWQVSVLAEESIKAPDWLTLHRPVIHMETQGSGSWYCIPSSQLGPAHGNININVQIIIEV